MNYVELVGVIFSAIALLGAFITALINLNVKIKGIDERLIGLQIKLEEFKVDKSEMVKSIDRSNDKIWTKLDQINDKLSDKLESIEESMNTFHEKYNIGFTKLQTEHENNICNYKDEIKKKGM